MEAEVVIDNVCYGLGICSRTRTATVDTVRHTCQFVCDTVGNVCPEIRIQIFYRHNNFQVWYPKSLVQHPRTKKNYFGQVKMSRPLPVGQPEIYTSVDGLANERVSILVFRFQIWFMKGGFVNKEINIVLWFPFYFCFSQSTRTT